MNASCHTFEYVMSRIWLSHEQLVELEDAALRSGMNESCHTYEWVLSRITHLKESCPESCHTYEESHERRVTTHEESHERRIEIEFAAPRSGTNEACHTYIWVMSHIWMRRVTHMNESCHPYEWVMSLVWMSRVTHVNVSCHTCRSVILCVAWIIHMCRPVMSRIWMTGDTTHS